MFSEYNSKISFLSDNSSLMSSLLITLSVLLGFFFLYVTYFIFINAEAYETIPVGNGG